MDPLVIVVSVVATILSIVLVVVSIQAILVLQEFRKTLLRLNSLSESVEKTIQNIVSPLHNLGGVVTGFQAGFRILENFSQYLKKNHADTETDQDD